MKGARLRHALEYGLFRAALAYLDRRPLAAVRRSGRRLGRFAYRLDRGRRRLVARNLALALPELGPVEHERISRDCYAHFGGHFCEAASSERFDRELVEAAFEVEGFHHLEEAERDGRGFFLVAGHYGSWELALYPLSLRLPRFEAVARAPDNPYVARDALRTRERLGARIVDKRGAGHRMINSFRKGARTAIIIDQHVRPSAGIAVPFFGRPAWTSPVLAMVSLRTRAPVIHFACVPVGDDRYRLTFRPPIEPEGSGAEAHLELTRRYLAEVERDVRAHPELWLWMHRRWRDSPVETTT